MALFFHTTVLPDDPVGFGVWQIEHYYQHLQFVQIAIQLAPPVFIPDYAIQSWSDEPAIAKQWLNAHQTIHDALRSLTGVQGIDLATVDLDDKEQWFEWMDAHAQEHILLEQAFGVS